jgi:hypothetical protein
MIIPSWILRGLMLFLNGARSRMQLLVNASHERTPFGGWRYDARPPALEALPRHHAVLYGELTEEHGTDKHALDQRARQARID